MRFAVPRKTLSLPGTVLTSIVLTLGTQGCDIQGELAAPEVNANVTLSFDGLRPLPVGLNYQAWLVVGTRDDFWGSPLVLFDVDEGGQMVDPVSDTLLAGPFPTNLKAGEVFAVAVSLEASNTLVAYSSYSFVMSGEVAQGTADLSHENFLAFGASLFEAAGRFVLATPTDDDPENERSGIWFMDTASTPAEAGIDLPEAPEGWNYESWVMLDTQPVSLGRFLSPVGPDSSGVHSGGLAPPPFPGEDLLTDAPTGLTFPADLTGARVFVTLEPWMEWDKEPEAPFFIRLLDGQVPPEAVPGAVYSLTSLVSELPSGTALVEGS